MITKNQPVLPEDIVNEILIIHGGYIQNKLFQKTLKKIPLIAMIKKINYLEKLYVTSRQNNQFEPFEDIILNNTSEIEREQMMTVLNTCNCCERHKKNRPNIVDYLEGLVPPYSTGPIVSHHNSGCRCICRHMCRNLCRAKNDEVDL